MDGLSINGVWSSPDKRPAAVPRSVPQGCAGDRAGVGAADNHKGRITVRHYPTNSPEAAARLLAMVLVADGNYSMTELQALDQLQAPQRLGLNADAFKSVLDHFCEDLLTAAHGEWTGSAQIDPATRQSLMDEVQNPLLREQILALCEAVAMADGYLAEGEAHTIDALAKAWRQAPAPTAL